MKEKITRERMEEIISYNVGYEKKLVRYVPLFIKELGTKAIYKRSEKSYTMTFSNLGKVELLTEYQQEVESFHAIMGVGKTQTLKCTACSYGSDMVITFSSVFEETYLQRNFFRALRKMGVRVKISSNGGSNETV
jgi:hypothetical protein